MIINLHLEFVTFFLMENFLNIFLIKIVEEKPKCVKENLKSLKEKT